MTARPRGWLVCATLEQVGLAIWVGGLIVVIGAVIPSVFNTLGMEPGGRFLARVFDGYNRLVGVAIVLLLGGLACRLWWARQTGMLVGPRRSEAAVLAMMVTVAALIAFVLAPRTISLQEEAFLAPAGSTKQAAYDAFFRTHHLVRGLYLVNLALGIGLVAVRTRAAWYDRGPQ